MHTSRVGFLSVVMPAYNEEASVGQVVEEHLAALAELGPRVDQWELLCLDDASTDRTPEILRSIAARERRVRILRHPENGGISRSFTELYHAAQGTHIYATASDGQWPAANLALLLDRLLDSGADLIVGMRSNRRQVYSLQRRIVSRVFNTLPRLLFGVTTGDAGSIKLGIREVFAVNLVSPSLFMEAERIIKATRDGYNVEYAEIEFRSRSAGKATGARWSNVAAATRDCVRCVGVYGLGRR